MFELNEFSLRDMTACGAALRAMGRGAASMEQAGKRIVQYLYDHLGDEAGNRACALVRFFITLPYGELEPDIQRHAEKLLGGVPTNRDLRCQTLLATVGDEPAWNDRQRSAYYKVLPLTPEILAENPMYIQAADAFGILLNRPVTPDAELIAELEQTTYNVFHVEDAVGSEYIPDQEQFVIPYGIHSIIVFFGMLPSGEFFSVVIFLKIKVRRHIVEYFKTLALNVKMAILPFDNGAVFAQSAPQVSDGKLSFGQLRSEAGSLRQLLEVQERVVVDQSERIDAVMTELRQQAEELAYTNVSLEQQIIENEALRQQAAEMAILEERNRLARDLHDSVTQSLYSLTLFAEASQRLVQHGDIEKAGNYLGQVSETAQQALKEMRLLVYELRPLALEETGLVGALQQRLDAVEGRSGVETHLLINDMTQLPADIEEALYRITQEALNNTLKHANATSVTVQITIEDPAIQLKIQDDGDGFDINTTNGGIGLNSMRERAEKLGASLEINSVSGSGTQILLELVSTE